MTESEWLADTSLDRMIDHAAAHSSKRKMRLFAVACCRQLWDLLPEASRQAVETSEQYADGPLKRKDYDHELRLLQGELVALQEWVKSAGAKICIVFEGRDTAGKGGTIKRITERVSPRVFRVVALECHFPGEPPDQPVKPSYPPLDVCQRQLHGPLLW